MLQRVPRVLLIGLALALAEGALASLAWGQLPRPGDRPLAPRDQPPRDQPPRDQPPPMPADQQAAFALHQAYDDLTLVSVWMDSKRATVSESEGKLPARAEDFYRNAHRAYKAGDYRRAGALAVASIDASRGLLSVLHASTAPASGLPAPPEPAAPPPSTRPGTGTRPPGDRTPSSTRPGGSDVPTTPRDMARRLLSVTRNRIIAAEKSDGNMAAAKPFLTASRDAYERGRQAYEKGEYTRAMNLAAGAETWTHIGDRLRRAEGKESPGTRPPRGGTLPPPADQPDRPRPPRDREPPED